MAFEKLKRTYYDTHTDLHTAQDHHQDFEEYHQPLNRMQNSNFFDWGIVKGLNVTGTIGSVQLQVNPGVGIDAGGRLISLATGGQADIGANPMGTPPQNQLVAVPVTLTTAGFHGKTVYVTIQHSLYYSTSPTDPSDPGDYEQIPWVRLQDTSIFNKVQYDKGESDDLILAKATIDNNGNITSVDGRDRKIVETSIGKLTLRRGNPTTSAGVFDIKEDVTIEANGDNSTLTIGAKGNEGKLIIKDGADRESLHFNSNIAWLRIGAKGNEGDLEIKDSAGRQVLKFDGNSAALYLGANGNEGDLVVKDSSGNESGRIDGNEGKLNIKKIDPYGNILDIDARYLRIHGWDLCLDGRSGKNNRALVDYNNKLILNFGNDYTNGVQINNLHLSDHIKVGFWEEGSEWNPGRYQWHTFYEKNTHLKNSEWQMVTMCEIGMYDKGTVNEFWWQTDNVSYVNNNGEWIVKWNIEYGDRGTDWLPWHRAVCWIAFRK